MVTDIPKGEVAERLIALRESLGYHRPIDFVRFLATKAITAQHLTNWESGRNTPSISAARHIALKTRVTTDWIFWGDRAGVPHHMIEKLDAWVNRGAANRA